LFGEFSQAKSCNFNKKPGDWEWRMSAKDSPTQLFSHNSSNVQFRVLKSLLFTIIKAAIITPQLSSFKDRLEWHLTPKGRGTNADKNSIWEREEFIRMTYP